jgi:hypothetical protein
MEQIIINIESKIYKEEKKIISESFDTETEIISTVESTSVKEKMICLPKKKRNFKNIKVDSENSEKKYFPIKEEKIKQIIKCNKIALDKENQIEEVIFLIKENYNEDIMEKHKKLVYNAQQTIKKSKKQIVDRRRITENNKSKYIHN